MHGSNKNFIDKNMIEFIIKKILILYRLKYCSAHGISLKVGKSIVKLITCLLQYKQ